MKTFTLLVLVWAALFQLTQAYIGCFKFRTSPDLLSCTSSRNERPVMAANPLSRRDVLGGTAKFLVPIGAVASIGLHPVVAAEEPRKEWISGRSAQPKGSDDKTGTRKETKYLRCLSNCLADCQKPTSGQERDREECLQTCQDECCTTYEQCTYPVTQNR
ncbi:unnamed protein product [Discosporangium mesarthrocarpum]